MGQATLRSSPRTSRTYCAGGVRCSFGAPPARSGLLLRLAADRLAVGARARPGAAACASSLGSSPCLVDPCASDSLGGGPGAEEQGRRDSNPQPPVLETGALPIELLPSGAAATIARPPAARPPVEGGRSPRRARASRGGDDDAAPAAGRTAATATRSRRGAGGGPREERAHGLSARRPARGRRGRRRPGSGAGDRTSVRSVCSALRSLRYCASSAWHRRQPSTWRARPALERLAVRGGRQGGGEVVTPHGVSVVADLAGQREEPLAEPLAGAVQPDLGRRARRCRARRRWPRGAGRRRRGGPRPAAGLGGRSSSSAVSRSRRRVGHGEPGGSRSAGAVDHVVVGQLLVAVPAAAAEVGRRAVGRDPVAARW